MLKSLKATKNPIGESARQLELISQTDVLPFGMRLDKLGKLPLKPTHISTLQVNLGKMCNQVCDHCHVDAGPDRKEIMTKETMLACLNVLKDPSITTVDLTGGAPEMNPEFRWFVEKLSALGKKIIVRCNLTIIVANKKYNNLPDFFKKHNVEIVSSLPCYTAENTDKQRGDGVFKKSIQALQMLNKVGYGIPASGLTLNLVYNPGGASLPPNQLALENDYKTRLKEDFGIEFNNLFTITNMPISRFLDYLVKSENYEPYMTKLSETFNPEAVDSVMCREIISVGWDGFLYDCDFNQMLDLKVVSEHAHISSFNKSRLEERSIVLNQHCYGCTAGSGSGCGGSLVEQ